MIAESMIIAFAGADGVTLLVVVSGLGTGDFVHLFSQPMPSFSRSTLVVAAV